MTDITPTFLFKIETIRKEDFDYIIFSNHIL